ncbi:type IV pilus biogenesis protein PilM [Pseudomonas sp. PSKL.D1]|uniref:type IV pilus biogenesis protein PilM n=1 Tax=Pseudomonas sp. PSKL.D1 TaxID=3029060 RepID=UPI0023816939|nr:pilus assembly protein PilM [Pseudomonas sp. PSKL.D1]WDY58345.1 pilus assembly protein PilM [Pseudomonas sp. PSKL.D1]
MLGRYGKDAGSLLGVEIAPDSVRMLQLRRRKGRDDVIAWAVEPLAPVKNGEDWQSTDRIAPALRAAFQRCGSRQRRVALALPASQVICKLCHLPAGQSEADLEAGLLADADRLFPFPLEDLAMDFQLMGPSQSREGCVDVMVAASRQSALQALEAVIDTSGLQLDAVEVDTIALRRMLPRPMPGGAMLLRIEPGSATLHYWENDRLPQRREMALDAAADWLCELPGDAPPPDELLVTGLSMAEQDRLDELSGRLRIPCRPLPQLVRLDCSGGDMTLACALAKGGMS